MPCGKIDRQPRRHGGGAPRAGSQQERAAPSKVGLSFWSPVLVPGSMDVSSSTPQASSFEVRLGMFSLGVHTRRVQSLEQLAAAGFHFWGMPLKFAGH